jgi:hypothetical protein
MDNEHGTSKSTKFTYLATSQSIGKPGRTAGAWSENSVEVRGDEEDGCLSPRAGLCGLHTMLRCMNTIP